MRRTARSKALWRESWRLVRPIIIERKKRISGLMRPDESERNVEERTVPPWMISERDLQDL
jgi:hypothetical protein